MGFYKKGAFLLILCAMALSALLPVTVCADHYIYYEETLYDEERFIHTYTEDTLTEDEQFTSVFCEGSPVLQQADEAVDNALAVLDESDSDSVNDVMQALDDLCTTIAGLLEKENRQWQDMDICGIDGAVRAVKTDDNNRRTIIFFSREEKAAVVWNIDGNYEGHDHHDLYYYMAGDSLLGCRYISESGEVSFSSALPQWKENLGKIVTPEGYRHLMQEYGWASGHTEFYIERAREAIHPTRFERLSEVDEQIAAFPEKPDLADSKTVRDIICTMYEMKEAVDFIRSYDYLLHGPGQTYVINGSCRLIRMKDPGPETRLYAAVSSDGRAAVFWRIGGDSYTYMFVLDGILIGMQLGFSGGSIGFAAQLPQWKTDPEGEAAPLYGDNPMNSYDYSYMWPDEQIRASGYWQEMKACLSAAETGS